jgi:hypothetical protein
MTKFDEMRDAANKGRRDFIAFRDRSWGYLIKLVTGFSEHCGVPNDQITLLRWNGLTGDERAYSASGDGKYVIPQAAEFDEEDGYWHLGVRVTLSDPGNFPVNWFAFTLCVTEEQCKPVVKLGFMGKPQSLDFEQPTQCAPFYEGIVTTVMQRIKAPIKKDSQKTIGFTFAS